MNPPVRELGDEPWNYAPKKVRHREQSPVPLGAHREGDTASQNPAPESGQPPWKRSRENDAAPQNATPESMPAPWKRSRGHRSFVGDVAIVELRNKLALAPNRLPDPPAPSSRMKYGMAVRLAGVAVAMAVGIMGYKLGSGPPASMPHPAPRSSQSGQPGLASEGLAPAAHALQSAPLPSGSPASSSRVASGQLNVGAVQPQQAGEPARLTVSAADAGADAAVVIGGLAPGWTLSTGTQVETNTWRLSIGELAVAAITPPRGFVGAIDLTPELRLADNTVADRKRLRLEWSGDGAPATANAPPAKSQPRRLDASEIALMVKSGTGHMTNGNISAARMMFQPAAEAGDPVAAFALAETYDPVVLRKLNAEGGVTADFGLAQTWYQKAKDLGSAAAPARLERLTRLPE
jgi:TPR repeat protein